MALPPQKTERNTTFTKRRSTKCSCYPVLSHWNSSKRDVLTCSDHIYYIYNILVICIYYIYIDIEIICIYVYIYIWIIPTSITRVDSLSKGSQLHPAWEIRAWNVDLKHWSSEIWVPFSVEIPKNHLGNWSKKDGKSWKTNNFPGEFNWITMKVMEYEL